jgi:uncharacterized protein
VRRRANHQWRRSYQARSAKVSGADQLTATPIIYNREHQEPPGGAQLPSFFTPVLTAPGTPHRLINRRNAAILADRVVTAFDSGSRRRGLLGLDAMPAAQALIIAPCSAIHTFSMRFAIDVAFITKAGRIVKTRSRVQPQRMAVSFRAYAVIELADGTLQDSGTTTGDTLLLVAHGAAVSGSS